MQSLKGNPDEATMKQCLRLLMKICRAYCIVPTSHAIVDADLEKFGVKDEESPNIWAGVYREQEVLITVLWQPGADDEMEIKVSPPNLHEMDWA